MNIAQKLSWEIVAMNDRGAYEERERMALEIAYGVALALSDTGSFSSAMSSIIGQVSDKSLQHSLRVYTARGLKK